MCSSFVLVRGGCSGCGKLLIVVSIVLTGPQVRGKFGMSRLWTPPKMSSLWRPVYKLIRPITI